MYMQSFTGFNKETALLKDFFFHYNMNLYLDKPKGGGQHVLTRNVFDNILKSDFQLIFYSEFNKLLTLFSCMFQNTNCIHLVLTM